MKTITTIEITDELVDASAAAVDKLDPKNQVRTAHIKTILRTALPIIEKAVREQQASAWSEGFKAGRNADHNPMWWPKNPYRIVQEGDHNDQ